MLVAPIPTPNGAGISIDLLRGLIYDDKEALDMLDEALRNGPGRPPDLFDETGSHCEQQRPTMG